MILTLQRMSTAPDYQQTAAGLAGWFGALRTRIRKELMARRTRDVLRRLDDEQLDDIGLNRTAIDRVAARAADL
ncbi:MAG: DUF1127 domain-containing protein [Rhodobacteraceae bacterium]|nr:DUF1127 domain-containing protein [Paracoccaceae bacterium]